MIDLHYVAMSVAVLLMAGCNRTPEPSVEVGTVAAPLARPADSAVGEILEEAPGCGALHGSAMIEVSSPRGETYCIDSTEVTQQQYAAFLKSATASPGTEHARCAANRSYAPAVTPSDPLEPRDCPLEFWSPDATPQRPVVCVDWCDAHAYCAWAGKRLCGKIGGGSKATQEFDPETSSQWHNACSQGGAHKYPYGNQYDSNACLGAEKAYAAKMGSPGAALGPAADRPGCAGTDKPFSAIVDLSGSVREWTDECDWIATAKGGNWWCALRGGDFLSPAEDLSCASPAKRNIGATSVHYGFRCCKDAS